MMLRNRPIKLIWFIGLAIAGYVWVGIPGPILVVLGSIDVEFKSGS